ncbi:MAG: hypothetical protein GF421_02370 [Candidatus Aminicenantes bacterium]|nr:hypothetical protein [Candidatus Aminicenantes bacterium]
MRLKILWPGKTKSKQIKDLQDLYIQKISHLSKFRLIETRASKGIDEKNRHKILKIESEGLEKYFNRDYIICLSNNGKEIDSREMAQMLREKEMHFPYSVTFVAGGFLGLSRQVLDQAHFVLSLSRMTFSHELIRILLLEQIYRSLTIMKGKNYAK